jgi:tetratricopeptide (TPR) repeat protein
MWRMFRSSFLGLFAAVVVALGVAPPAHAQDWAGRARLQGIVKDDQGKPVQGAKITLRFGTGKVDAAKPGPPQATTDKNGRWMVGGLADGAWGVLMEAEGFVASEGQITANETGPPAQAVVVTLRKLTQEQKDSQAQAAAPKQPSKTAVANQSIVKGNELLSQQKYADARAEYQKAVELLDPPNQIPLLRAIATTYYKESVEAKTKEEKTQKVDQAVAALKQTLVIKPDDTDSMQLLVNLLVSSGREAEAKPYIAQLPAEKVDPDMMLNVGIKYYNAKQLDKALAEFSQVIEKRPELPDSYYYRGLVYLNLGKTAQAKADFKKLLEIDPNHKYAKEAKEYLSSL